MAKKSNTDKATKPKKVKKEVVLRLEDVMMNCRNIMRGKANTAIQRDVILTFVFLKFMDERFSRRRAEVKSDLEAKLMPEQPFIEDANRYESDGVIYLEEDCRWKTILLLPENTRALELDNVIAKLNRIDRLKGALPAQIFTNSRIDPKVFKQLAEEIDKIDENRFHEKDLIGRVYEYFLQAFAVNATKEEGEFYTPHSIVETIASLIEPLDGTIYDPCCGSGGMFVQSLKFVEAHSGNTNTVQVYGQESDPDTYRLAKMNLAIRGISYDLGVKNVSTFTDDLHKGRSVDFIMANPPFNLKKWRGEDELLTDRRWSGYDIPPASNANYAWILHMLSHLDAKHGMAGFLLANGALGDSDTKSIRQKLIENDKVEAIIVLPREMFYTTDISVTLWILNNNKSACRWHGRKLRNRKGEVLFCDLRTWNQNVYDKKYVQFLPDQIEHICNIYHTWQQAGTDGTDYAEAELYRSVGMEEIEQNDWSLVPSRYIEFVDRDSNIDYESVLSESSSKAKEIIARQIKNQEALTAAFKALGYE